jgi:hypothetical protein
LIGCKNPVREKCLREKLAFLNESSVVGSIPDLWCGYFVISQSDRNFFFVDTKRKAFCAGPYP